MFKNLDLILKAEVPLIGVGVVVMIILSNLSYFIFYIINIDNVRIKKLKEALEGGHVKGLTKCCFEDKLETEYFKDAFGVSLGKYGREELIKAHTHASTNEEVTFLSFIKALPHISYKKGKLVIEISLFNNFYYYFHLLGGILLAVFGIFLVLVPVITNSYDLNSLFFYLLIGMFFMLAAGFMVKQTSSVYSARLVRPYLLRYNHDKELKLIEG
ncbi:hypothetical protein [Marinospirillum minutulum]|uniref:hypothetical protein n=1 Tax=Marinospirillum minutulum TaxID=64974 RepID=UPI00040BC572|nr:hypothetical protein [Marinospirillum minutulum]